QPRSKARSRPLTENLFAKWGLIFALIGLSIWLFISNSPMGPDGVRENPIKLGIDLRGGRSITYEFSRQTFEKIPVADRAKAFSDTIDTVSKRIDTLGVRELVVRPTGGNQFVIEAP